jgi:hypothetical protein
MAANTFIFLIARRFDKFVAKMGNDIAATRLQTFTTCLPRISVSHANCIRLSEPGTREY